MTTLPKPRTIRDLVDVQAYPTVVRLDHLHGEDAGWITAVYHVTPAVDAHLKALRHALSQPSGTGLFLIGQYGSGKTHLLAYVVQNLRAGRFLAEGPDVVALSLLNYRGDMPLEEIVAGALGLDVPERGDRRVGWGRVQENHPRGLLLVIDELSEFLRSKPDRSQFIEDVRFLQFMGEWSQGHRFWVLASMQEQIEHTGDLEHSLYRKIKDRYPIRFILTPAHVRELVRDAILIRREGCEEVGRKVAAEARRALPRASLDLDAITALYPIHPATLEILEEVRDSFSQARGVVDFTVTQLAGDPARGVEPFLDRPAGELLTPEHIVDHFRDLFEVQFEYLPLAQQLFPWYDKNLARLFGREPLRRLAERLLKLLVLVYLSPSRDRLTAEEAAAWLLYRISKIDAAKNVAVIKKVLGQLADEGRFVSQRGAGFRLDFEEDDAEAFERRLESETADCELMGMAVFEQLASLLEGGAFDPFALPRDEVQNRSLRWHFHDRRYGVYLGNGEPPAVKMPLLVVRLFFGEAAAVPGALTLVPARLTAERRHFELAALCRLRERKWKETTARKLAARIAEKLVAFENEIRNAHVDGVLLDESGRTEAGALLSGIGRGGSGRSVIGRAGGGPSGAGSSVVGQSRARRGGGARDLSTFEGVVESLAEYLFERRYPAFERFAPSHGPLPGEAYRRFMAFALEHDIGADCQDDYVKLIREAYLVPMELLTRKGRAYVVPKNIERHELYRLLRPLLEHRPMPKSVHEHLAAPVYGLVPDQIHLLLIFLLILGEIDILKEGKSYRELAEMLPDTRQYDRIEAGRALGVEQLRHLEALCEGVHVSVPKQWNVLAQRRAIQQLRARGQEFAASIQPVVFKLEERGQGRKLVDRLRKMLEQWRAFESGDDEISGFEQFLYEIGSVNRFLGRFREVADLPARLERLLEETRRYAHLLGNLPRLPAEEIVAEGDAAEGDVADRTLIIPVEHPGEPPDLDEIEELETWLKTARSAYEQHKTEYTRRHAAWWREIDEHPLWRWRPPEVAASRHLALDAAREAWRQSGRRAEELRCRGPLDLDFRPVCRCGFDGRRSPVAVQLENCGKAQEEIESSLRLFFGQQNVRDQVRALVDEGIETTADTLAYLDGAEPCPRLQDLERFDRSLAGIELVKTIRGSELLACLSGRTWERAEVLSAIEDYLAGAAGDDQRLRFEAGDLEVEGGELAAWCLRQSLRHGVRLPRGLGRGALDAAGESLHAADVSAVALRRIDGLGLGDALLDRIAKWMVDGLLEVPAPPRRAGEPGGGKMVTVAGVPPMVEPALLTAVRELHRPSTPGEVGELATLAAALYSVSARLHAIAGERWLSCLDQLATTRIPGPLPELTCALDADKDAQWLVIDCLGLALLPFLMPEIIDVLDAWRHDEVVFAKVGKETTTDAHYRQLVNAGLVRAFLKINALDTLIHEHPAGRPDAFDDLARRAAAELRIATGKMARDLDPACPLVVFADHGFRLARDGRSFVHGGASTLERVVPILRLVAV